MVYISLYITMSFIFEIYGSIAISNESDPFLGMASPGPIVKYIDVVNINVNNGPTILENLFISPNLEMAITPKIGKIIAVIEKNSNAIIEFVPASLPKNGGKIKFPAPKYSPKIIILIYLKSFFDKLFINSPFLFCYYTKIK